MSFRILSLSPAALITRGVEDTLEEGHEGLLQAIELVVGLRRHAEPIVLHAGVEGLEVRIGAKGKEGELAFGKLARITCI